MANIRGLKKDISYVATELVIECFTYNYLIPEKNQDELASIIADSISMKMDLNKKIHMARHNKNEGLTNQLKKVRMDLKVQVEELIKRLEGLSKN